MNAGLLDIDEVVSGLADKLGLLETVVAERLDEMGAKKKNPKNAPFRRFANVKAMYNAWEADLVKVEDFARRAPAKQKRSHLAAEEATTEPGQECRDRLMPYYALVEKYAAQVGGKVIEQTKCLGRALDCQCELVGRAATIPKPTGIPALRKECASLIDAAADVTDYKDEVKPRDKMKNHHIALAETAGMLGWVVAPAPVKHVNEYEKICSIFVENVLASFIELGCNPVHTDFAEALKALVEAIAVYVREIHPAGLKWNYMKGATPLGYRAARIQSADHFHPLADYLELIDIQLEIYLFNSSRLGGLVHDQAKCISSAFHKQYEMVTRAASLEHQGTNYSDLKVMFLSTMHELTPATDMVDKAPQDYPFAEHLRTAAEFAGILMWPVVFDVSPPTYTADVEAGIFVFYEKVEALLDRFPRREWHLEWIRSLKGLAKVLRLYVTRHHNSGLTYDSRAHAKEVPDVMKRKEVAAQVKALIEENKGNVKHFEVLHGEARLKK